jgi:hypothetical protein
VGSRFRYLSQICQRRNCVGVNTQQWQLATLRRPTDRSKVGKGHEDQFQPPRRNGRFSIAASVYHLGEEHDPHLIFVRVPRSWLDDIDFAFGMARLANEYFQKASKIASIKYYTANVLFDQQPHGETTSEVIAYQEHSNPKHRFDNLRGKDWRIFPENPGVGTTRTDFVQRHAPHWRRLFFYPDGSARQKDSCRPVPPACGQQILESTLFSGRLRSLRPWDCGPGFLRARPRESASTCPSRTQKGGAGFLIYSIARLTGTPRRRNLKRISQRPVPPVLAPGYPGSTALSHGSGAKYARRRSGSIRGKIVGKFDWSILHY